MTWIAGSCVLVGLVLTAGGLYRRDPDMQRRAKRLGHWFQRTMLRRRQTVKGRAELSLTVDLHAEAQAPLLDADPALPSDERLGRAEKNIETLYGLIRAQSKAREEGNRELRASLEALRSSMGEERDDLRQLIDEKRAPERMEWAGLVLVILGTALALAA